MSKKSVGREKAKENSFIRKGSRPEEYSPNVRRICNQTNNCDLCGQHISYDFLLEHKTDPDKNLYVGSDCIITFCETYLPNIAATMLRHMEMKMEEIIEAAKANDFKEKNPNFAVDKDRLYKSTLEILDKYKVRKDFVWGTRRLPIFETLATVSKDFRKKGYITKPKLEEINQSLRDLDSGHFEDIIKEYSDNLSLETKINDDINKNDINREFYEVYFKYSTYIGWNSSKPTLDSKALSKIEQEIFLTKLEDYLSRRLRLKNKLIKNKNNLFDAVMLKLIPALKIEQIELGKWPFSNLSQDDSEKIKKYKFSLEIQPIYSMRHVHDFIDEYGLKSLKELRMKKIDSYVEIVKDVNYYPFNSFMVLFETEESGQQFVKKIEDYFANKLNEIIEYLSSDELANDNFN